MTKCAICGQSECVDMTTRHLVATFDCTFEGQGKLGAGLEGGALYGSAEVGHLLDEIQRAKVAAWPSGGANAAAPTWIAQIPALQEYFSALGKGDFEFARFSDHNDACSSIGGDTDYHAEHVRDLLEALLIDCGWDGITTSNDDDYDSEYDDEEDEDGCMPGQSSAYKMWWDSDANGLVKRLGEHINEIMSHRSPS